MEVAAKLQVKPEHGLAVLHLPHEVDLGMVGRQMVSPAEADVVLVFVRDRSELETQAGPALDAARRDALAWIAYPKAGKLGTDLNRDRLWAALADAGVRPVRQVAIDDTWSALRFRPS